MSYWVELLGSETRFIQGRYRTRTVHAGDGFPMVLLHGMGGHLENFVHNIPAYAKHFRTVAMDFLWHGCSQTEGFDEEVLPPLVDQVRDVIDTLGFEHIFWKDSLSEDGSRRYSRSSIRSEWRS